MMKKIIPYIILTCCVLLFVGAAIPKASLSAASSAVPQEGIVAAPVAETTEPNETGESGGKVIRIDPPKSIPKTEPEPEKYTVAWAERYAPGSCAPYEEQVGDNGIYLEESEVVRPPKDTYRIVVDYENQAVWAYSKDLYGDYTVLERVMICTTGGNGNWTPEGHYKMGRDYHRFGFFTSFNCYAQYWTQMAGNFYFHSILYRQRDASTLTKSSYNNLGNPGSHGCIRLMVPDARWMYENCAPGTLCDVTTVFPRDDQLRSILKHGAAGAVDYVPAEEDAE